MQKIHNLLLDDWYAVGLKLEIPGDALNVIEKNYDDIRAMKREMFSEWLKRDTMASYKKLIDVLQNRKETICVETLACIHVFFSFHLLFFLSAGFRLCSVAIQMLPSPAIGTFEYNIQLFY